MATNERYIIPANVVDCFVSDYDSDELKAACERLAAEDGTISLPAHFEVCSRCRGRGVHDHPAFSNGFTRDDEFVDEDFIRDYMSGAYDVACEHCHGARVEAVADPGRFSDDQKIIWQALEARHEDERSYRAEVAAERRMGA